MARVERAEGGGEIRTTVARDTNNGPDDVGQRRLLPIVCYTAWR